MGTANCDMIYGLFKTYQIQFVILTNLKPDKKSRFVQRKLWENIFTFKI